MSNHFLKASRLKILKRQLFNLLRMRVQSDLRPSIRSAIKVRPMDGDLYYRLGNEYFKNGRLFESIALYRSAIALGNESLSVKIALVRGYLKKGLYRLAHEQLSTIDGNLVSDLRTELELRLKHQEWRNSEWRPEAIGYGKYQRLKLLAARIECLEGSGYQIADIGGGQGEFSVFIPGQKYTLIEPSVTGISAPGLPFKEKYFDVVVCADVLEHLPKPQRKNFILELIKIARKKVFITVPVGNDNRVMESYFWELTQNPWTAEHLEHEYSTFEELSAIFESQNIIHSFHPISFLPVHFAMGYLNSAFLKSDAKLMDEVNIFFNSNYSELLQKEPSYGYLIEVTLDAR